MTKVQNSLWGRRETNEDQAVGSTSWILILLIAPFCFSSHVFSPRLNNLHKKKVSLVKVPEKSGGSDWATKGRSCCFYLSCWILSYFHQNTHFFPPCCCLCSEISPTRPMLLCSPLLTFCYYLGMETTQILARHSFVQEGGLLLPAGSWPWMPSAVTWWSIPELCNAMRRHK